MQKQIGILAIALAGVGLVAPAAYAERGDHGAAMFQKLDVDGNGEVSVDELNAAAKARFDAADADGDGALTQDEMKAARKAQKEERKEKRGERREMSKEDRAAKMLERFDKNEDGALDAAELAEMGEMHDGMKKHGKHDGKHGGKHGKKGERGAHVKGGFKALDADEDGKVTFEEMQAKHDPAKMIEHLDTDGNGTISAEEFGEMRRGGHKK
ncbi:MAG: EF-hand domain-containing protein [Sulfitobacter sp.]